jgi:hypothetical protein
MERYMFKGGWEGTCSRLKVLIAFVNLDRSPATLGGGSETAVKGIYLQQKAISHLPTQTVRVKYSPY